MVIHVKPVDRAGRVSVNACKAATRSKVNSNRQRNNSKAGLKKGQAISVDPFACRVAALASVSGDRYTDGQASGATERQTDGQASGETDGETERQRPSCTGG